MTLRVAVVGSGPAGSSAAETLAKAGIETYLFERKLDNAKPCGGAIPLCMVSGDIGVAVSLVTIGRPFLFLIFSLSKC